MKPLMKPTLTALVISTFALGALSTFASVEPAFAKSEKAASKSGESRGKSSEARSKSADRGKSSERSSSSKGKSGEGIGSFFAKLTGKEQREVKRPREAKSQHIIRPKSAEEGALGPSDLGNMNGALNANINAVLAHIRNGNGNGPVGHVAVLAAATASADGAQETLDRAALFDAVVASPYDSLEGYYLALEGVEGYPTNPDIENAVDKDEAAIAAGFASYEDYAGGLEVLPAEPDAAIDQALADLGVDTEVRGDAPVDLPLDSSDLEVGVATESLENKMLAEQSILAYWNKNPGGERDSETGLTAEEQKLLDALQDRFSDEDLAVIQETVASNGTQTNPDAVSCEESNEVCALGDEIVVLAE